MPYDYVMDNDFITVVWALRYWELGIILFLIAFSVAEKYFAVEEIKAPTDPYALAREQYRLYTEESK